MAAQQNVNIRGRVVDQNGLPVIGASVFQSGTRNGTVTDVHGNFSLRAPAGTVLQVECMGYKAVSVTAL